ncbi:MAG: cupin domain-containing protein [Gammaproteobacteria bacterium]
MGNNLFADIPSQLPDELTEVLVESRCVRIERIVSEGHRSDQGFWYDQDEHEWVLLIQGSASIEYDNGELIKMAAGDYCLIPAHQKHRVKSTSKTEKTIWLAIFYKKENANEGN